MGESGELPGERQGCPRGDWGARGEVEAEVLGGELRGLFPWAAGGEGDEASPSMSAMKLLIHSVSRSFIISSRPSRGRASCSPGVQGSGFRVLGLGFKVWAGPPAAQVLR